MKEWLDGLAINVGYTALLVVAVALSWIAVGMVIAILQEAFDRIMRLLERKP